MYNKLSIYVLAAVMFPMILSGAEYFPSISERHGRLQQPTMPERSCTQSRRYIALLAVDPEGATQLLASRSGRDCGQWGLFSGLAKDGAVQLLSRQTAGFYGGEKSKNFVRHLASGVHERTGDTLNVVAGKFFFHEILLAFAKNISRKNFCWVPVASLGVSRSNLLPVAHNRSVELDEPIFALLKTEWGLVEKALVLLSRPRSAGHSYACLLKPATPTSITITNALNGVLDTIKILVENSVLKSVDNVSPQENLCLNVSDYGQERFSVRIEFMNNAYTYELEAPIAEIEHIALQYDIASGLPCVWYSRIQSQDEQLWEMAQLKKCLRRYDGPQVAHEEPNMFIPLYNANMNIKKIRFAGKSSGITRGFIADDFTYPAADSAHALWTIPAFQDDGAYLFEVHTDTMAYTWRINFLAPDCELMLIQSEDAGPTLWVFLEGICSQAVVVPLLGATELGPVKI